MASRPSGAFHLTAADARYTIRYMAQHNRPSDTGDRPDAASAIMLIVTVGFWLGVLFADTGIVQ